MTTKTTLTYQELVDAAARGETVDPVEFARLQALDAAQGDIDQRRAQLDAENAELRRLRELDNLRSQAHAFDEKITELAHKWNETRASILELAEMANAVVEEGQSIAWNAWVRAPLPDDVRTSESRQGVPIAHQPEQIKSLAGVQLHAGDKQLASSLVLAALVGVEGVTIDGDIRRARDAVAPIVRRVKK